MAIASSQQIPPETVTSPWHGFKTGLWQKEINVRDFIQQNYEPYEGDESFLAHATERASKLWDRLNELFVEERKKGVVDISQIPSSITAHGPGYIDRENENHRGPSDRSALKAGYYAERGLSNG
jgi:formate C-acetyltransferase